LIAGAGAGALVLVIAIALLIARGRSQPGMIAVSIATNPPGAAVMVDGKPAGRSPFAPRLEPGEHTLTFTLDGYRMQETSIQVAADRACCGAVTLLPIPAAIRFWTDIAAASVSLDGQDRGVPVPGEALEMNDLGPGDHMLAISSPEGGAELQLQTGVASLPQFAAPHAPKGLRVLLLSVMGSRARVQASAPMKISWDGVAFTDVGSEALELSDLQPATRELTIDDGSGNVRKAVVVLGGSPALNAFVLSGRALDFGGLLVRTSEPDITILLDGRRRHYSRMQEGLMVSSIAVGRHKLDVKKEGYQSSVGGASIQVQAGKTVEVDVALTPIQPSLTVSGAIRGTQVLLDGKMLGTITTAPLHAEAPQGAHNVELRRRGYHSKSFRLAFEPGGKQEIGPPNSVLQRLEGKFMFTVKPDRSLVTLKIEPASDVFEYTGGTHQPVPAEISLPPGHYNLIFSAPGYRDHPVSAELVDGERKPIPITLERR
jgi:hypothetical protein